MNLPSACFVILFQGREHSDSLRSPLYPVEFSRRHRVTCWVIRGDGVALGTRAVPSSISSVGDVGGIDRIESPITRSVMNCFVILRHMWFHFLYRVASNLISTHVSSQQWFQIRLKSFSSCKCWGEGEYGVLGEANWNQANPVQGRLDYHYPI